MKTMQSRVGLLLLAAGFLVFTLINQPLFSGKRLDLTENQLYSVSDGTRKILAGLDSPVTLNLYFSDKLAADLPALRTYAQRVRELLDEYVSLADGNLKLAVIDPEPFSEAEDSAAAFGLQGVPIGVSGDSLYFGLAGQNSEGDQEIIAFLQPDKEQFLEYDITRLIYQLSEPEIKRVGIITGLNMQGGFDFASQQAQPAWMIAQQVQTQFEIDWLSGQVDDIGDDIDMLILAHPKHLAPETLLAIDQFVLKGGKLVAFVDPFAEREQNASPTSLLDEPEFGYASSLPLLEQWGVAINPDEVLGDYANSMVVSLGASRSPVRHIGLLSIGAAGFNGDDVVMAGLESMTFSTSGVIRTLDGATTQVEPLVSSSDQTQLFPSQIFTTLRNPQTLLETFAPEGTSYPLAVRISGPAQTAYPQGVEVVIDRDALAEAEAHAHGESHADGAQETTLRLPEIKAADQINVVVVADTDVLSDRLWVDVQNFFGQLVASPWADNGSFVVNLLENLSGNSDLIGIRSRGQFSRPFEVVQQLKLEAEERFLEKERELQARLQETEARLAELQQKQSGENALILSPEEEAALQQFQQEKLKIRKQLRDVQHQLDKDIEALAGRLKLVNIALVPLVLTLAVAGVSFVRRKRQAAAAASD